MAVWSAGASVKCLGYESASLMAWRMALLLALTSAPLSEPLSAPLWVLGLEPLMALASALRSEHAMA